MHRPTADPPLFRGGVAVPLELQSVQGRLDVPRRMPGAIQVEVASHLIQNQAHPEDQLSERTVPTMPFPNAATPQLVSQRVDHVDIMAAP